MITKHVAVSILMGSLVLTGCGGSSNDTGTASSTSATSSAGLGTVLTNPYAVGTPSTGPAGWPGYIAMGAVGGPNLSPPTATSTGGDDDFGGKPVDVVFKYAGDNGRGNPGDILPPVTLWQMTQDWGGSPARFGAPVATPGLSKINQHPTRIAIVEYTGQMSGGLNYSDFTNTTAGASSSDPTAAYIMAKHFISLGADAQMMVANPVVFNGVNYYGSLVMNPDLLGAIQQNNYIDDVNANLAQNNVNTAVAQAMCVLNTKRSYTNQYNPNDLINPPPPYLNKSYTGTPVEILIAMLNDGYPAYSFNGTSDPYWNSTIGNQIPTWVAPPYGGSNSQIATWFDECLTAKPTTQFPSTLDGWIQANNYMVRSFAPKGTVTFGWQDNMWAVNTGYWVHNDLTPTDIGTLYSNPVTSFLKKNAPSTMDMGANGIDFFVFDRYEYDDSSWPSAVDHATLDNARAWDNILTAVGQVSRNFNNIPIMLFQIPGSHITNTTETTPEILTVAGGGNPILPSPQQYVFSSAPVYFFGDSNLKPDLSNIMTGPNSITPSETMVGSYPLPCGPNINPIPSTPGYNCINNNQVTYKDFLLQYQGKPNNFDWSKDNGKLKLAAQNNVFAILWGGGETTSVIKNFKNNDDNGWLASKIKAYLASPTLLSQ